MISLKLITIPDKIFFRIMPQSSYRRYQLTVFVTPRAKAMVNFLKTFLKSVSYHPSNSLEKNLALTPEVHNESKYHQ